MRSAQTGVKMGTAIGAILATLGAAAALLRAAPAPGGPPAIDSALRWRAIGPAATGGRVTAVAGVPGDPAILYVGTAAGGIFKSLNGGTTWKQVFSDAPVSSIGALAVAPSDPNVVWVGTGEANPRNDVSFGNGVYWSGDGGSTWSHRGLDDSRHIARIVVDPQHPGTAYAAALGHVFGPNAERGIFRTRDGGLTWSKVLFVNDDTGASDVAFDPANPRVLYAGMWEVRREAWWLTSGGSHGGLFKSLDGGEHWTRLTGGLPEGPTGRIGIGVAASNPDVIYALVESRDGELYRSDDQGQRWRMINGDHAINQRPFYFSQLAVAPANERDVYALSVTLQHSTDGGHRFEAVARSVHGDHHALWIDPRNPRRLLDGSDGGVAISDDGGLSWRFLDNLPIGQFYRVAPDGRTPFYVCGGLQDNSVWCGPTNTERAAGILNRDWYPIVGGDGMYGVPDPRDHHIIYADAQNGDLHRVDLRSGQARNIQPYPEFVWGWPSADARYRFNWTAPVALSPLDPSVLYLGGNVLFKSTDQGQRWSAISPDLTRNDRTKQQVSGGPITTDMGPAEHYDTIFSIAESPVRQGVIWIGTDDGLVHVTRDGGTTWANVSGGLPASTAWSRISSIAASRFDPARAYITVDRHFADDLRPYVYRTQDYGTTWAAITSALPDIGYTHVVREDPQQPGLLYLGTELGVFASLNDGGRWQPLRGNLPVTPVYDLFVQSTTGDLVIGTHGSSIWVLDDVTPIRYAAEAGSSARTGLLEPRPALRYLHRHDVGSLGDGTFAGDNPPLGAIVNFFLQTDPAPGDTVLSIEDEQGRPVRTQAVPAHRGFNRVVWDLRYDAPALLERVTKATGIGMPGPLAVPGHYTIRLRTGGHAFTKPLRVGNELAVRVSASDLDAQLQMLLEIKGIAEQIDRSIDRISQIQSQLRALRGGLPAHGADEVTQEAERLEHELQSLLDRFSASRIARPLDRLRYPVRLRERLLTLAGWIASADAAPTGAERQQEQTLLGEFASLQQQLEALLSRDLPRFNQILKKTGHAGIGAPPG